MAQRANARQCNVPYHNGHPEVEAATLVPLILATILFLVRMTAKTIGLGGGWGSDDYTIIVAEVRNRYTFTRLSLTMIDPRNCSVRFERLQ